MDIIDLCRANKSTEALELLKYPDNCKLDQCTCYGNTALMVACDREMTDVVLKMLKHPDKCKLNHVNKYGITALMVACCTNLKKVALEMLKHPDKCKLDQYDNKCRCTALIFACHQGMTDVALEILKYHNMCAINHVDGSGNTALFYAQKNNMTTVTDTIYKYVDIYSALHLKNEQKELFDRYVNKKIDEKINQMSNNEEMQHQYNKLNDIIAKTNELSKYRGCIVCFEETHSNTVFVKCKHILCVCSTCCDVLEKKCPICRIDTPIITGCFVI